jgi:hypothetical protein
VGGARRGGAGARDAAAARRRGAHLVEAPDDVGRGRHELEVVEGHEDDGELGRGDELLVDPLEPLERLAARRKLLPPAEHARHARPVELQPDLRGDAEGEELGHAPLERVEERVRRPRDDQRQQPVGPHVLQHGQRGHRARASKQALCTAIC